MNYAVSSYAVLLVLHLLAVVFVVGPLATAAVTSPRAARAGDAGALRAAARTTRLYARASVVVVVLGLAMIGNGRIGGQWEFSQPWVGGSLALWFAAVAVTEAVVVPAQKASLTALEAGGDGSGPVGRMTVGAGVAMLAWASIIALMVLKPL